MFRGTVEEYRALYMEKNAHLEQFLEQVTPFEFYREIFPEGSFERKGHFEDSKPNGIVVSLPGRGGSVNGIALEIEGDGKAKRYIITDDLKRLDELKDADFTIMAPISYFGRSRSGKFARFLYALAFDLDGVGMPQLRDVLHQMDKDILPKATFVVNSGPGLHLYYVLTEPVPMYPQNQTYLKELKFCLTEKIWNRFTSTLKEPQMQGIMQGFRVVGSGTKLGRGYPVVAFRLGGRVELDTLLEYVPESNGERQRLQGIIRKTTMPLAEAKEKYPEWYERRIVKKERRGRWTVKRDLYDWWLRRIQDEIHVGHRYHGIMTLAIYAKKCGIDEDELRQDAYSLLLPYDEMSVEQINRFTKDDIEAGLAMFNEDYVTFPRDTIGKITGLAMPVNKRNGLKQDLHLKVARATKIGKKAVGVMKPEGRPEKRDIVAEYMRNYPEVRRKTEIARALGIDRGTVAKYYDNILKELQEEQQRVARQKKIQYQDGHITVPVEPPQAVSDFLVAALAVDDL